MVTVRSIYNTLEIEIPEEVRTLESFRCWAKSGEFPERGRVSFIDQEIYLDMIPENIETHNKVKTEVYRVLAHWVRTDDLGEYFSDGVLVTHVEAGISNEPDGTFVSWQSFETGKARSVATPGDEGHSLEIEGSPDWVLGIVSNSSVRKDTQLLREAYHRAGIPEYWLIDARGDEIAFSILVHRPEGYVALRDLDPWQQSEVFAREFRLDRERGRLDRWQYTLHHRPT